jgi:predicted phosphohydrolase
MQQVVWLTDIHLDFLADDDALAFLHRVAGLRPDAVLLGGDLGEADSVARYLRLMDQVFGCPVYFVLGNHDFYRGSITPVRQHVEDVCRQSARLVYLTAERQPRALAMGVGLLGHDGWGDARCGNFLSSPVMLSDFAFIDELRGPLTPEGRLRVLRHLGDEAAEHARQVLPAALQQFEHVVFLTHVPPFREACWYDGRISDDDWAPYFTCLALGEVLRELMQQHPSRRMTVLCGHTHGSGEVSILDNLHVITGGARYGHPAVQRVFKFE